MAIHDGARPLVTPQVIQKCVESALKWGAGVAGMPVKDTIKEADPDGRVRKTLRRESLWQVQTPQTFRYTLIMEAHRKALEDNYIATDDSALVEYLGRQVYMIPGGYMTIKDYHTGGYRYRRRILKSGKETVMRVGIGYDVHRL